VQCVRWNCVWDHHVTLWQLYLYSKRLTLEFHNHTLHCLYHALVAHVCIFVVVWCVPCVVNISSSSRSSNSSSSSSSSSSSISIVGNLLWLLLIGMANQRRWMGRSCLQLSWNHFNWVRYSGVLLTSVQRDTAWYCVGVFKVHSETGQ